MVAHGASHGITSSPPPPAPSPARAGEGAQRGWGCSAILGLTPAANFSGPPPGAKNEPQSNALLRYPLMALPYKAIFNLSISPCAPGLQGL